MIGFPVQQSMVRSLLAVLLLPGMLSGPAQAAGSATFEELVPAIVDAHFGSVRPDRLETLSFSERVVVHAAWQSRRPDPPWDRSRGERTYAIGFEPRRFAEKARIREAGGYDFHYQAVLDGELGFLASFIDGYQRALEPGAEWSSRTADVFRRTPSWIVRELAVAEHADVESDDARGSVIRFESSVGPVVLGFDDTLRLRHTRWQDGDATSEFQFDDYRWSSGIATPRKTTLYWRGERVNDIRIANVVVNEPIEDLLLPAEELPLLDMPDATGARDFGTRELADGIWLIGEGVNYQLFVEYDDHVVALGSVGGVGKRLEALRELIDDKPVRYAMVTHHHSDHLEGVRALVDAGATLLVAPAHASVVSDAAGDGRNVQLELVRGRKTLGHGSRSMQIIDIGPNVHAEQMLVAYLPAEKILWSADMFVQPPERPLRTAIKPIRDLAEAIEAHGLDVERLVDPHSPRINTIADLWESVAKSEAA